MTKYTIRGFIADAKAILATDDPLERKKEVLGERLAHLAKRDDLLRSGAALGPADASTENYLLWRESPNIVLLMAQFDQHYVSPVHEHDSYWVIGCGYRGRDRWDMYERLDDGSDPTYADLRLFDQYELAPGQYATMPTPPKAIHSHNNEFEGSTLELIFSAAEPNDPSKRVVYDVEEKSCRPSWWTPTGLYLGGDYPTPHISKRASLKTMGSALGAIGRKIFCPVCTAAGFACQSA